ncbi:MAG: S8 family serine peptidase [Myxococcota bacterium]
MKAWVTKHFAPRTVDRVRDYVTWLPFTAESIHRVKGIFVDDQQPAAVCFGSQGAVLEDCGRTLQDTESEAQYNLYGARDPELFLLAEATGDETPIPVAIWLRTFEPSPAKEHTDSYEADLARLTATASQAYARTQLLLSWPSLTNSALQMEPRAPVAYAELLAPEIENLAFSPVVARISWARPNLPQSTVFVDAVNAAGTGATGSGETVCVIEGGQPSTPNNLVIAGTYCGGGGADLHAREVIGVVRSTVSPFGVASSASLLANSWGGCDANAAPAFADCDSNGAHIWNWSHTCNTTDTRLFDYWAKTSPNYPLISIASGNGGPPAIACGAACGNGAASTTCRTFNTLIVGGSNDCGTASRTDDRSYCPTSHLNVSSREYPHLVASAQNLHIDGLAFAVSGTSFAAPAVAGAAAQMHEVNSALRIWPEVVRSILMNGASEVVDGGPLDLMDAVDDRDGAGELSVQRSLSIAYTSSKRDGGNTPVSVGHDYGTMTSSGTPAGSLYAETYYVKTTFADLRLRAVLSFDATTTCTNPALTTASCVAPTLDGDLDLFVYRDSDGVLMAYSATAANSYEFVEFAVQPNVTYRIVISAYSWTSSNTYWGLSWLIWPFSTT